MVRISEIERPSQEVSIILERVRIAERFPPGYYASHSGWGIGPIRDNTVEALIIDFSTKPSHRMSMTTAEQALDAFPPADLRVMLRYNVDEIARLVREEPVTLLAKALLCLSDGKGTTDEIRKALVPMVMPTGNWANWWKGAQEAAARDPRIDTRQAYNNVFALAGESGSGEEVHLPVWDPQKSAAKNIAVLDTFLSQHPDEAGRLLEEMEERILTVYRDHARIPQAAAMAGLLILRIDNDRPERPGSFIAADFNMNALNKRDQEQLLDSLDGRPGLISALNSRLVGVRRKAWERLESREDVVQAVDQVLAAAQSYPEAALHILEMTEGRVALGRSPDRSRSLFVATLDLLEDPPRESHRKRAMAMLDAQSPLGEDLSRFPIPEDDRTGVTSRLRLWRSSDRFRFPAMDFLRSVGHQTIAEDVEGARARSAARLSDRVAAVEDPFAGMTLFTRPTFTRLQEERQRVGMELKTTIPRAIQKARELGDLRENAEYDAAKEKQASYAKRFEELDSLLDGVRLIESLEREDGVALPGTEVELEDESGSVSTIWLLGEGDQDVGEQVVSYLAAVGKALCGRRVGDEVSLPRDGSEASYRIRRVSERLP
jgi:transcription elongation factor GreA